jgi:hypothetical protein
VALLDELDALHWTYLWIGHEVKQGRRSFAGSAKRPSEKETIHMGKNKSKWIVSGVRAHTFFANTLWIHIGLLARF